MHEQLVLCFDYGNQSCPITTLNYLKVQDYEHNTRIDIDNAHVVIFCWNDLKEVSVLDKLSKFCFDGNYPFITNLEPFENVTPISK